MEEYNEPENLELWLRFILGMAKTAVIYFVALLKRPPEPEQKPAKRQPAKKQPAKKQKGNRKKPAARSRQRRK